MVKDLPVTGTPQLPAELDIFCREEYPRVFGALVLFTGEQALSEELAQEAFTRVCRDWPKVSRMDRPGAWVHRVAMNLANSRFRRRGSRRRAEAKLRAGAVSPSAPTTAEAVAVRTAVADLQPNERAVIVLRYFADLSVAETAIALNIADGTVKTRTRRGIASLRASGLAVDEPINEPESIIEVQP